MSRRLADEHGQVLPLLVAGLLVVLLGFTALVVDVGRAYLTQRQLQAGTDAAALAGASALPDAATAEQRASDYSRENLPSAVVGLTTLQPAVRCLKSTPTCTADQPNVLSVSRSATVSTTFGRLLGIDTITVKTTATAARMGSTKPLDLAVVIDRTGSMSSTIGTLRDAVKGFLGGLDERYVQVTLVALPPVQCTSGWFCATDNYPVGANYVIDPLGTPIATVQQAVDRFFAQGYTSYKPALQAAVAQLQKGDPSAQKAIVFETDGAANSVPDEDYSHPTWDSKGYVTGFAADAASEYDIEHPCNSAVQYVAAQGIPVYAVGYALGQGESCYQAPHFVTGRRGSVTTVGTHDVPEGLSAHDALQAMATQTGGKYYDSGSDNLAEVLAKVASDLSSPRLVPDNS